MILKPNERRTYIQTQRYMYVTYASASYEIALEGVKFKTSSVFKLDFAEIYLRQETKSPRVDLIFSNPNQIDIEIEVVQFDLDMYGGAYDQQAQDSQAIINALNLMVTGIASQINAMDSIKAKLDTANAKLEDIKTKLDTANTTLTAIKNK